MTTSGRRYDVLVVGSANMDLVVRVARRPAPGETASGSDLAEHPGGKGANQAAAAARLGAVTALLARVGDDAYGAGVLAAQRAAGTDTRAVLVEEGGRTGTALIVVDASGENSIVVSPGANGRLSAEDVAAHGGLFPDAAVVVLQLEVPLETVVGAARAAERAGARVVLNPSPPRPLPGDLLRLADPLLVNEHEARLLAAASEAAGPAGPAGPDGPAGQAAALARAGARSVVVTLGAAGALCLDPRVSPAPARIPGTPAEAVDTTGAGDAFTGALAWRLSLGDPLRDAAAWGVRAGALAVTREGAQSAYPVLERLAAAARGRPGARRATRGAPLPPP